MDTQLIEAVRKREPLWNPGHPQHKNGQVLKQLWEEVGQELQKDQKAVRYRWKNLRHYYAKLVTKSTNPTNEEKSKSTRYVWPYYKKMKFLEKIILQPLQGSQGEESSNQSLDNEINENSQGHQSSTAGNSFASPNENREDIQRAVSDRDEAQRELEREKIKILQQDLMLSSNEDLLFFQSLLPYMKGIPHLRKLNLQGSIQKLVLSELEKLQKQRNDVYDQTSISQTLVENNYSPEI